MKTPLDIAIFAATKGFAQEYLSLPEDSLDRMLISLARAKDDDMNNAGLHSYSRPNIIANRRLSSI